MLRPPVDDDAALLMIHMAGDQNDGKSCEPKRVKMLICSSKREMNTQKALKKKETVCTFRMISRLPSLDTTRRRKSKLTGS
jgi:hypothetical protein